MTTSSVFAKDLLEEIGSPVSTKTLRRSGNLSVTLKSKKEAMETKRKLLILKWTLSEKNLMEKGQIFLQNKNCKKVFFLLIIFQACLNYFRQQTCFLKNTISFCLFQSHLKINVLSGE